MCSATTVCLCESLDPKGNLIVVKELKAWQKVLIAFVIVGGTDLICFWIIMKLLGIW